MHNKKKKFIQFSIHLGVVTLLWWVLRPIGAWAQTAPTPPQGRPSQPPSSVSPPAAAVGPEEVVMTVGEKKITAAEFEKLVANLPPQFSGAVNTLGKRGFADQYANLLGLALEGEKLKVDQSEGFRQMVAFQRFLLLAQVTLNELGSKVGMVSPEDVRSYYTTHPSEFEQAKVRGIYVPFEAEPGKAGEGAGAASGAAKSAQGQGGSASAPLTEPQARVKAEALRGRILAGEGMAALAKKESNHPTSSSGGDFGYVRHNQFTPQIDAAIFSLQPKQVSAPLRDRFGYFIFQVESKRVQPLEEAQPVIENNLRQQKLGDLLTKVRSEYPVVLNPRYFPESAPALPENLPKQ